MIPLKDFPIMKEELLRKMSIEVESSQEAKSLKDFLLEFFPKKGAFAVAAPQVGIYKRAFLAKMPSRPKDWLFVCNPKILKKEDQFVYRNESCLSFPGVFKNTVRYKTLKIEYHDEDFETKLGIVEDKEAVIFQHEIYHFDGVLFRDRVQKPIRNEGPQIGRNERCPYCRGKQKNVKWKKCREHNKEAV